MQWPPPASSSRGAGLPGKPHQLYRLVLAVLALLYAGFSYLHDDFYFMGRHSHYHGVAAGLLELMLVMAAVACLLPVIGVYDTRDARPDYECWRRRAAMAAYALLGMGMTLKLFNPVLAWQGELGTWLLRWMGWLGFGALMAQFGCLPPSYLSVPRVRSGPTAPTRLPAIAAYLAAAALGLLGLALLALAGWLHRWAPADAWGVKLVLAGLGLSIGSRARALWCRAQAGGAQGPAA